ncbi:MAG: hypothetical protein HY598_04265, partial [Candidatus Omnitrophica bacterium]|nr:hypothetical protein [Candidatus Omnitrophota bacterium]
GHAADGYTCLRPKFAAPAAMIAGSLTDDARRLAVALILQHTKEAKLPDGELAFWVNGTTWSVARDNVDAGLQPMGAVKL